MFLPCPVLWEHLARPQTPPGSFSLLLGQKAACREGGFWTLQRPGELSGAVIPDRSALRGWKPPAQPRFHNHPTPSLRAPFPAQTLLRASVSHPVSVSSGQTRSFEGKIHPLLMCRGRSWHGHGCNQNYSPKVQPWNFYCGSQ